ncbi:ABC transporter ATP-binding protein [Mesorhizobium sp. ANAO-SY3R2]|uniref:ABC transporter ATP-binding protein n=1 Tax=Mesorhizobium sp. ANAO-SY3R2 TaxID=3166644 RepID=UPI0036717F9F
MRLFAEHLAFGYRGARIGEDVSLSVSSGEVLCLLGPNGCGKTTLFKTLLGLLPRQGGHLELDGRDVSEFSRSEFARRVAYVPQATGTYFPFSVLDVVLMGRASRIGTFAAPSPGDRALAHASLETLGISHLALRPFTEISGGERQMTLIARALAQEPQLIVMDEPTASLDFGNQARVLTRISALAASGMALVVSTHDPGHAFACADRVALMRSGTIVAQGTPAEVLTSRSLEALYGVGVAVAFLEAAGRHVCTPTLSERNAP